MFYLAGWKRTTVCARACVYLAVFSFIFKSYNCCMFYLAGWKRTTACARACVYLAVFSFIFKSYNCCMFYLAGWKRTTACARACVYLAVFSCIFKSYNCCMFYLAGWKRTTACARACVYLAVFSCISKSYNCCMFYLAGWKRTTVCARACVYLAVFSFIFKSYNCCMFYWQAGRELLCVPGRVSTSLYLVVFPRVTTVVCFIGRLEENYCVCQGVCLPRCIYFNFQELQLLYVLLAGWKRTTVCARACVYLAVFSCISKSYNCCMFYLAGWKRTTVCARACVYLAVFSFIFKSYNCCMFYWQAGRELLCVPGRVSTSLYLVLFSRVTTVVCFIGRLEENYCVCQGVCLPRCI